MSVIMMMRVGSAEVVGILESGMSRRRETLLASALAQEVLLRE